MQITKFGLLSDCKQHIPCLANLWYDELGRHWNSEATVAGAEANLLKHLNTESLPLTVVAIQEDKPVGMASLRESDGLSLPLTPWLGSLVVDPAFRGCGIGEALVRQIQKKAIAFGHERLYLFAFDRTISEWYGRIKWHVH